MKECDPIVMIRYDMALRFCMVQFQRILNAIDWWLDRKELRPKTPTFSNGEALSLGSNTHTLRCSGLYPI